MKVRKKEEKIYLAGDLLKKGSIILREQEAKELRLLGYDIYSPTEDKSINDKQNQTVESNNSLAEKIVKNDTNGIIESDIIIIEPHENALGTMVELGQLKGMKDAFMLITDWLMEHDDVSGDLFLQYMEEFFPKFRKKVYTHVEDIRRTDIPEVGDRRSWGINQYVYGACLDLTNGKGLYDWEEIIEELKERKIK